MTSLNATRRTALMTASGLAIILSGFAVPAVAAQVAGAAQSSEAETEADRERQEAEETIVITGTRESLAGAIDRKKKAGTQADSIVAEDINSFPDKNIGEALQRVTGVQLTRDFGEGSQVAIRGVEPDLNRVEINGASVLGNNGEGGRGADFRELASELVKSIDVIKGSTADMTEGGVGGTVSIETRRPLELRKPLISLTGSFQHLETLDGWQPRANFTFADKFLDNRLGVLVNLTYDRNRTRADYQRNTEWVRFSANSTETDLNNDNVRITPNPAYDTRTTPASCNSLSASGPTGANRGECLVQFAEYVPRIPRYSTWDRDDQRISGLITLQYQVTDDLDVYVDYQRNWRERHFRDSNFLIDITASHRLDLTTNCSQCVIDDAGNLISFTTAPRADRMTRGAGAIVSSEYRDFDYEQDSNYKQIGFNWNRDRFRISGLAVTSSAETWSDNKSVRLEASVPSIRIDIDPEQGNPTFTFPTGYDPASTSFYANPLTPVNGDRSRVIRLQYRPDEVDVTEDMVKLDGDFEVDMPLIKFVEFGGQYRRSGYLRYSGGINSSGTAIPNADGVVVPTPYVSIDAVLGTSDVPFAPNATGSWVGQQVISSATFQSFLANSTQLMPFTFFPVGSRAGLINTWLQPTFNNIGNYFDLSAFNHDRVREVNGVPQIPAFDVEESIWAGYAKANFDFKLLGMPVRGNFGMRYVRTKDRAGGYLRVVDPNATVGDTATLVTIENSYSDWLPSANVFVELVPDKLIAFLGASKVLARPKPTDLVPNIRCNITDDPDAFSQCTAGNPDLKPYRADQYDASLSWYANRDTLLSAAFFYKDIKSFVINDVRTFGLDLFGDGTLYDVSRPENGAGAKIHGIELTAQTAFTFLPAPLDGFGFQANYTYAKATDVGLTNLLTGEDLPYPYLSENSFNLIGYYDKGWLNLRVAYNYRSEYLRNQADRSGNAVFNDATGYLDAKATFRVKSLNASFFVEGKNLTKEVERITAGDIRMTDLEYSGRRFYVGASLKF